MGKASKWFRGLLGLKKQLDSPSPSKPAAAPTSCSHPKPPKRRWSFVKSNRETDHQVHHTLKTGVDDRSRAPVHAPAPPQSSLEPYADGCAVDPSKHAIAVAAATAAVAEAAVAAAQAAAEVVRLTSSGRSTTSGAANATAYVSSNSGGSGGGGSFAIREEWAAVKIQSHFRAYLARRAFRALKALVKLQALVRGYIVRKQTVDMLRRMQALLRAQARARGGWAQISASPRSSANSSQFHHPGPATPEKFEHPIRSKSTKHDQSLMFKRNGSKSNGRVIMDKEQVHMGSNWLDCRMMDEGSWERRGSSSRTGPTVDEKSDKILEVDTGKSLSTRKRRNLFQSSQHTSTSDQNSHSFNTSKDEATHQTVPSPSSCEVKSFSPLMFTQDVEECSFCTADNSPQFYSASSRGDSSKRGPFTPSKSDGSRSCLSGYSDHPNYMAYTESSRAKMRSLSAPKQRPQFERSSSTNRYSVHGYGDSRSSTQRVSALHANFTSKAYPGSGRLDRLGMPLPADAAGFSGGHSIRY